MRGNRGTWELYILPEPLGKSLSLKWGCRYRMWMVLSSRGCSHSPLHTPVQGAPRLGAGLQAGQPEAAAVSLHVGRGRMGAMEKGPYPSRFSPRKKKDKVPRVGGRGSHIWYIKRKRAPAMETTPQVRHLLSRPRSTTSQPHDLGRDKGRSCPSLLIFVLGGWSFLKVWFLDGGCCSPREPVRNAESQLHPRWTKSVCLLTSA